MPKSERLAQNVAGKATVYQGHAGRMVRGYLLRLWSEAEESYRRRILDVVARAEPKSLLDLGCHDGAWTCRVAEAAGPQLQRSSGIEIVEEARREAERRGVEAIAADLNDVWPYEDMSFDLVHANQVIEHIRDLDMFVGELHRVLRPSGYAVVCTENLASWHNIAALVVGYMPFSLTNISSRAAIGNPYSIASTSAADLDPAWFHTRVLTGVAISHLFELHGLAIVERFSAGYHPFPPLVADVMARLDFRHAAFIGVVAQKKSDAAR